MASSLQGSPQAGKFGSRKEVTINTATPHPLQNSQAPNGWVKAKPCSLPYTARSGPGHNFSLAQLGWGQAMWPGSFSPTQLGWGQAMPPSPHLAESGLDHAPSAQAGADEHTGLQNPDPGALANQEPPWVLEAAQPRRASWPQASGVDRVYLICSSQARVRARG